MAIGHVGAMSHYDMEGSQEDCGPGEEAMAAGNAASFGEIFFITLK